MLQGTAWIGVIGADGSGVTTYNVTAGQVIFFPRNTVHWIKNVGTEDCVFLLFFTTHEELQTLDVDDAFFSTPEDIAARALKVCWDNQPLPNLLDVTMAVLFLGRIPLISAHLLSSPSVEGLTLTLHMY